MACIPVFCRLGCKRPNSGVKLPPPDKNIGKNSGTQRREEGWCMVNGKKVHAVLREMKYRDPFMNPTVLTRNEKREQLEPVTSCLVFVSVVAPYGRRADGRLEENGPGRP